MVTVRPARRGDAEGIARVHVLSWKSTYADSFPAPVLATLSIEKRAERWDRILRGEGDRDLNFVAESPETGIVGWASGGPNRAEPARYDGELYGIYLLREHQRAGTGSRLTLELVSAMLGRGYHSLSVWVLPTNPAVLFYEAIGAVRLPYHDLRNIGGYPIPHRAFGWDDLELLRGHLASKEKTSEFQPPEEEADSDSAP